MNNKLENQTKNNCYIINLNIPIYQATKHMDRYWVPLCSLDAINNLTILFEERIADFVFLITQSVACYFSKQNVDTPNTIANHLTRFSTQLAIAANLSVDDSMVKVMHLKKLIEDYIINQLKSVLKQDDVSNKFVTGFSIHIEDNQRFFFYC